MYVNVKRPFAEISLSISEQQDGNVIKANSVL